VQRRREFIAHQVASLTWEVGRPKLEFTIIAGVYYYSDLSTNGGKRKEVISATSDAVKRLSGIL